MKKNMRNVMAMGMVLTILAGTTAFAAQTGAAEDTAAATQAEAVQSEAAFLSQSGKVVSVEASQTDGVQIVTIENEQGGLRFAVAADTVILNRADGAYLTADQITEGMEVAVIYGANSPMGMSMPPYLGQVTAVVANADAGDYAVGHFDEAWTDESLQLQLNLSEDSNILNLQGAKIRLLPEDVQNSDALVFYDATTRSIPAQTNPSLVLLLTAEEETTDATDAEPASERTVPEQQAAEMVPLRETAEAQGYTVTWRGKTQPVLLEKDGVTLEVAIGADSYVREGDMMMQLSEASKLVDGVLYVSDEIFA